MTIVFDSKFAIRRSSDDKHIQNWRANWSRDKTPTRYVKEICFDFLSFHMFQRESWLLTLWKEAKDPRDLEYIRK